MEVKEKKIKWRGRFLLSEIALAEEKKVEEIYKQILSWFKLPIKIEEELGLLKCNQCGADLCRVRGRYPKQPKRIVCPTCAIETLEHIQDNLQPRTAVTNINK